MKKKLRCCALLAGMSMAPGKARTAMAAPDSAAPVPVQAAENDR